jgi:hypothetical protein
MNKYYLHKIILGEYIKFSYKLNNIIGNLIINI